MCLLNFNRPVLTGQWSLSIPAPPPYNYNPPDYTLVTPEDKAEVQGDDKPRNSKQDMDQDLNSAQLFRQPTPGLARRRKSQIYMNKGWSS
jgi:hypothetical protein